MIKKILVIITCLYASIAWAGLDDQIIANADNTCKIHYLSPNTKKLWSIQTSAECPNGWVEGFTSVRIFNAFGNETETLVGFFKNGYLLDKFVNLDTIVSRGNPKTGEQTLTFLIDADPESHIEYLALLHSKMTDKNVYPPFSLCEKDRAYFLVVHQDSAAFKNPIFQSLIFKKIRSEAHILCPDVKRLIILGTTNRESNGQDWFLQADMDITSGQTNLRFHPLVPSTETPTEPTELRQEQSENLVAVQPVEQGHLDMKYNPQLSNTTIKPLFERPEEKTLPWDYSNKNYSILDFALLARIAKRPVQGQVIAHINSVALDGTGFIDKPISMLLSGAPDLKPGWVKIKGKFNMENDKLVLHPLILTTCKQEWCNEN